MKSRSFLFFSALILALPCHADEQPWRLKIEKALLQQAAAGNTVEFIVVMAEQADLRAAHQLEMKNEKGAYVCKTLIETAHRTQKQVLALLDNSKTVYKKYWMVNAIWVYGDLAIMEKIAALPEVGKVTANPRLSYVKPVYQPAAAKGRAGIEWSITRINADDVWALGYKGQGVVIGGQDTGYEWDHPAIKNQYRGWNGTTADHNYNWHDAIHSGNGGKCGVNSPVPCDDHSHGTHTMGTMVGDDGDTNQIGMAPAAKWIGCRNMDVGNGTPATYIECFEWFMAPTDLSNQNPDVSKAPHVINNSWGCPPSEGCDSSNFAVMNTVVNNLRAAGIVVVVSAGNSGPKCSTVQDPAAMYEGSFSVGATQSNDTIAGFSSRGPVTVDKSNRPKPNISAPGVGIRSSVPGGQYGTSSGTSMAGPHVAGLVALIISANPGLAGKVDCIEDIIEQTALRLVTAENCGGVPGNQVPNNTYGHGRIDAFAAVKKALETSPCGATSVQEKLLPGTAVNTFPNPFSEKITFTRNNSKHPFMLSIYSVTGQTLASATWPANKISYDLDLSWLAPGVYFFRTTDGIHSYTGKIFKKD